jgi:large subunit ribosomal protein L47
LKSFKDLHTLWYVTLRERNLLATQREEARRAGIKTGLPLQTALAGHVRLQLALDLHGLT